MDKGKVTVSGFETLKTKSWNSFLQNASFHSPEDAPDDPPLRPVLRPRPEGRDSSGEHHVEDDAGRPHV